MDKGALLVKRTVYAQSKIPAPLVLQDTPTMLISKIAYSVQPRAVQSILDVSSVAIKFRGLLLFVRLVHLAYMYIKSVVNVSSLMDVLRSQLKESV